MGDEEGKVEREGERGEGGKEEGRKGGREEGRKGGREGGREGGKEGGRKRGKEGEEGGKRREGGICSLCSRFVMSGMKRMKRVGRCLCPPPSGEVSLPSTQWSSGLGTFSHHTVFH